MILELKYDDRRDPESVVNESRVTIFYHKYEDIKKLLPDVKNIYGRQLSTLVIWGTHGSANDLCKLEKKYIYNIVEMLAGITFRTIVLDACESALHAQKFIGLLSQDSVILCHMGICPMQVLQAYPKSTEDNIREKWASFIQNVKDAKIAQSFFPAIYRLKMMHLMLDGMEFESEEDYGNKAFDANSLADNVKSTNSEAIGDVKIFLSELR